MSGLEMVQNRLGLRWARGEASAGRACKQGLQLGAALAMAVHGSVSASDKLYASLFFNPGWRKAERHNGAGALLPNQPLHRCAHRAASDAPLPHVLPPCISTCSAPPPPRPQIYRTCKAAADEYGVSLAAGANIIAFLKVAEAVLAQGAV